MGNSDKSAGKILSLDGMRFIAILIIMLSHLEFFGNGDNGYIYTHYLHNAQPAVDYFFLLSGFGMMLGFIKRNHNRRSAHVASISGSIRFGIRHIRKIYPTYILFLLIGIPYQMQSILQYHDLLHTLVISGGEFVLSIFMLQSATGIQQFSHAFNGPAWFLSSLFVIYLISPKLMALIHQYFRTIKRIVLGLIANVVIIVVISGMFMFVEAKTPFDDFNYSSPWKRVFYVTLGMFIAMLYIHTYQIMRTVYGDIMCCASFALSIAWFLARNTVAPGLWMWVYGIDVVLCGVMLYSLAVSDNVVTRFFSGKEIVWLGGQLAMYLYMSHYLIRMYLDEVFRLYELRSFPMMLVEVVLILSLSFLVSTGLYQIQHRIDSQRGQNRPRHGKSLL